jgi:nucleoside-diphosphate-sugar epimerase
MEAPLDKLSIHTSYNIAGISFTVKELAEEINKHLKVEITYKPDFRQAIADSWPRSLDDSQANKDWGWKHSIDLPKMVSIMIESLQRILTK